MIETHELALRLNMLKSLIKQDGKVFLALVHEPLYGPAKGMNGILVGAESIVTELDNFLSSKEKQEALMFPFYSKTGMVTKLMVLPSELIAQAADPPQEFDSLEKLVEYLEAEIVNAPDLETDPFYFRKGEI